MKKTFSVLVVDDAFFIRNLIKRAISNKPSSEYPYTFEILAEGTNGEEGLQLYKLGKPDIITIDVNMPNLGGVKFIKELRKVNKDAQIIVISSTFDEKVKGEILNLGAYFIQKPFQEAFLWVKLDKIAEYLMSQENNKVILNNDSNQPVKNTPDKTIDKSKKKEMVSKDKKVNKNKSHKSNNKKHKNLDESDILKDLKEIPSLFISNTVNSNEVANKHEPMKKPTKNKYKAESKNNKKVDSFITEESIDINSFITGSSIPNLNTSTEKETIKKEVVKTVDIKHAENLNINIDDLNLIETKIIIENSNDKSIKEESLDIDDKDIYNSNNTFEDEILEEKEGIEEETDIEIFDEEAVEEFTIETPIENDKSYVNVESTYKENQCDIDFITIYDEKEDIVDEISKDEIGIKNYTEDEIIIEDNEEIGVNNAKTEITSEPLAILNLEKEDKDYSCDLLKSNLLSTIKYDINTEIEPISKNEESSKSEEKNSDNKIKNNIECDIQENLFTELEAEIENKENKNDFQLSELELDLAKLQNLELDLSQDFVFDNPQTIEVEPLEDDSANLLDDSAINMELNEDKHNYNTVKSEKPQVKITPPKNKELSEIYSAKFEKDYNVVSNQKDENSDLEKESKKSGGLLSKIFKKK